MTIETPYVAVDWGTTRLRAYLCTSGDSVADRTEGPGVSRLVDSPADTLFDRITGWAEKHGAIDLLLGGMVGSNIGWRVAPYLECPANPETLANDLLIFEERGHQVAIVPGLSCTNALGEPDVMRGEETQILGWMADKAEGSSEILCLPGTHTKWVSVRDGRIEQFTTSVTGELFALLRDHSVLVSQNGKETAIDDAAFSDGVNVALRHGDDLLHALFSTRSRALFEQETAKDSLGYLSGLLTGADIRTAIRTSGGVDNVVHLIGNPELCKRYALALRTMGMASTLSNGDDMVVAGFKRIAELAR